MAARTRIHVPRHLNGEHTTWCSQRKGGVIVCKYTGQPLKQVDLPTAVEESE